MASAVQFRLLRITYTAPIIHLGAPGNLDAFLEHIVI